MTSKKKKYLKPSDPIPEDIHWEWLEVAKAIQAACKDNQGFAKVTVSVSVHKNKPVLWSPVSVSSQNGKDVHRPMYCLLRLSPKRVADYRFTSETAAALIALHEES